MMRLVAAVVLSIWSGSAWAQSAALPRGKPKALPKGAPSVTAPASATGTAPGTAVGMPAGTPAGAAANGGPAGAPSGTPGGAPVGERAPSIPGTPIPGMSATPVAPATPVGKAPTLPGGPASALPPTGGTAMGGAPIGGTPVGQGAAANAKITPGFTPLTFLPCQDVFANFRGGEGFFSKEGQAFFFVTRPTTKTKSSEGFFDIYTMDVVSGVIKRLLGVQFADSFSFIGQGYPLSALGIYNFKEFGPECLQGRGTIQSLVILNKKEPKLTTVFNEGNYSILYGIRTFTLLDNTEGVVKEYDLVSGQKRTITKMQNKGIPFLYDKPNNKLVTYELDEQELTVTKLALPGQKVDTKVKLPVDTKIFVDGDRVGFINKDIDANEITVREVKGLTGTVNVVHKFAFPKGYSVLEAGFVGNLDKRLIAVTAFKQEKRKSWTRTFLVDYLAKKIITVQRIPDKHYVSSMYFNNDGTLWVSMIKDDANRLAGVSIYNMTKNKWFTPKLPK